MSASGNSKILKKIEVVALAMQDSGDQKYLLARRGPAESGAGEWEFPGGKIEAGETQKQALIREIQEELGFDISAHPFEYLGVNLHQYPNRDILIHLWKLSLNFKPNLILVDHDRAEWYTVSELDGISLSAGDKPFVSLLNAPGVKSE